MKANALKRLMSTAAVLALVAEPALAGGFNLNGRARHQLDAEAQRMIDERLTPGIAIGIMSEGRIIYAKGFGAANLETGTDVSVESVFRIGSMTKQFTAAAVMLLVEQNMIELDAPLSRYLPDFPRGGEVTIRNLLNHTSGIRSTTPLSPSSSQLAGFESPSDMAAYIRNQPDLYEFEPGTSMRYSNSGYYLLGAVIEKVSGLTYPEFLEYYVFERAGLTVTAVDDASDIVHGRVSGYDRQPNLAGFANPSPPLDELAPTGPALSLGPAGAIRSNVVDVLRWQYRLSSGWVVSPDSFQQMTTPGVLENGQRTRYGFGFSIGQDNGHRYAAHNGGLSGFTVDSRIYLDDRVSFVVLTNTSVSAGAPRAVEIMSQYLTSLVLQPR